jgi:hypothetical protein
MITKGNLIFQIGTLFTVNTSVLFSLYLHNKYSINNNDKYDKYELSDIII